MALGLERTVPQAAPNVLADCVRAAVIDTIEQVCGEPPQLAGEAGASDGIIGVISFVGDLSAGMTLGFPRETAVRLALRVFGCEMDFDSADMGDATGEIANIVAGYLVARLDERGITVQMSMPSFLRGRQLEPVAADATVSLYQSFRCAEGDFWVHATSAR